jgi:hypothetical protein
MHNLTISELCKYTKVELLAKKFPKTIDLLVSLCYNIIKEKDRAKAHDIKGGIIMKTMINISTDSYTQTIDNLDYECTAQEYIDGCIMNNDDDYFAGNYNDEIIAEVYEDDADPMFDEPVRVTTATIEEV